jgi:hypothetical protein
MKLIDDCLSLFRKLTGCMPCIASAALTWLLLVVGSTGQAAAPADHLLKLVPRDVGLCLVVQDLRGHAHQFLASPFFEQLCHSPLGEVARKAPEARKIARAKAALEQALGTDLAQVRDEILGDAFVLAYRPGSTSQVQEQGLLLLHARDSKLLADVVERCNEAQRKSGELKQLETRRHGEAAYFCRIGDRGSSYYLVHGPLLALSCQEEPILHVIDAEVSSASSPLSIVTGQFRRLGADGSLAALWINPRTFDREITGQAQAAEGVEAAIQQAFCAYWKALEGAALWLTLGQSELQLNIGLLVRRDELANTAPVSGSSTTVPSELCQRFPPNAILTIAGDFASETWSGFLTACQGPKEQKNGRGAVQDGSGHDMEALTKLLPRLGPDMGICIAPPPSNSSCFLPNAMWALRVRTANGQPGSDDGLFQAIHVAAELAVMLFNNNHDAKVVLETTNQGTVRVDYVTGPGLPAGFRPAYALADGFLLITTNPEAITSFRTGALAHADAGSIDVPFLRFSCRELRRYIAEHRGDLSAHIHEKSQLSENLISQKLDRLIAVLQLCRDCEVTQRVRDDGICLSLRMHTEKPLIK